MTVDFEYWFSILVLNSELNYSNTHIAHLSPVIFYCIERGYSV